VKKIYIIQPDGTHTVEEREFNPELKELQTWVKGYIEHVIVRFNDKKCVAYVNEEGKLRRMPVNWKATSIFHNEMKKHMGNPLYNDLNREAEIVGGMDYICGPMVIVENPGRAKIPSNKG
jgi:hypothetical protein